MIASSVRSSPIVIIATTTEASTILDALSQYRGCFGGKLARIVQIFILPDKSTRTILRRLTKKELRELELK